MESQNPRDVFEQLVPGVAGGDLERVLDLVFASSDPHEGYATLDAVHASLLRDSREVSRALSKYGLSYQKAQRMVQLLGRDQVPDFMRITIQGAGMSRLATKIAAMGFALEQAQYDLFASLRDTAPADLERIAEITTTLTEPFIAYLAAPTAERLALSGWHQQPNRSTPMTRREIYADLMLGVWADTGARKQIETQAKLAELLYGRWFDKAPGH